MIKLSSRPASMCHPSESATLEDTNLRDVNYSRQEQPRNTTVGDVPSNKEEHPLYPKIHIPIRNPGMYPGCPLTTTDRTQKTKSFSTTHTKTKSIPVLKTNHFRTTLKNQVNFGPRHEDQVNFDPHTKIKSISEEAKLIST